MTGPWKCKKCDLECKGRPNRIMSHLFCMEDRGVKICEYMKQNPDEKEELARRLGRDPHPEKTSSTNGVGSEMLNSIHQGQSSQLDSTQPSFPLANPDQTEEFARRLVETNAVCSQMINTGHQGQSSPSDSTQPFFPRANPDEMEELARGLGRNPPPEQMGSEMINTTHQGQSFQPGSTQSSFLQRGMHVDTDAPIPTPSQVYNDHLNDHDMHALLDDVTVNPSLAVSSMDIQGKQQLQPGEEDDIMNDLGDTENTSSRAVISSVCANREHHFDVPELGSAGREGGASPDVRMQNVVSQEKGSKKRKCAPGSGASATALQLDNSEQSLSISVSNLIISPPETSDASMSVPQETCIPGWACVPNTNSGVVQGTNDVDFEPNNTIHQGQSSLPDSVQVSSPQGGMGMGLGDQIPHRSQGNFDRVNDEDTLPPQDEAGIDASTPGNAFGVGMASEPGLADPPPIPLDFPDSWTNFEGKRRRLYPSLAALEVVESAILKELNLADPMLGAKRKMEMKRWLGYVGCIKSDVSILDVDAMNAKSPSEIPPLLKRTERLIIGVQKLIEMGNSLVNPVPKDLLSWNPSFMDCGSQLQNQMASGPFPQQV